MRQYVDQKASAPDALLLFRMGDFYETFYEDAETAARVLGIALTSRSKAGDVPIPLAGIPHHALESYLIKLVHAGFKVAISEQVEDPRQAKGVVKREIVRIVTPGTLTEDALLEQRVDNYLACVCRQGDACGLAFIELSTGAFWVQMTGQQDLINELVRLSPAELLLPEMRIDVEERFSGMVAELTGPGRAIPDLLITRRPAHLFDTYQASERLQKHFGVATLEGFGFRQIDASLCAAAVIIDYLAETQKTSLHHIITLRRRSPQTYVSIDQSTWRSLEIERTLRSGTTTGSLVGAIDRTSTAMGARCLRRWLSAPLRDANAIRQRQDAIAQLLTDPHQLGAIRTEQSKLADIERITARLGVGRASPRDLVALGNTLLAVERIAHLLDDYKRQPAHLAASHESSSNELVSFLAVRCDALCGLTDLAAFLTTSLAPNAPLTLNDGGIIAIGYDDELDRLRNIGTNGQQWLAEYQAREIERTNIPSLKVGFNQVFGYYIEITHTHHDRVPPDYVRKQTLKNAERYITDELKKHETEVLTARDRAIAREVELFDIIRQHVIEQIPALQALASAVAEIDVMAALAYLADAQRYVRPELVDTPAMEITNGRHPVLEQTLAEKFVPNDCRLGLPRETSDAAKNASAANETLVILTGPNMAGKSTYIRQTALLALLAQTGSYVPADAMRFGPVDAIFARVGASDEISRGQSTFMVEMTEAANILNNATEHSLVIIDELGRGTSTFDGLALAWAITEQLVAIRGRTLFATHYHELTQLENLLTGIANYNVAVREWEDQVIFLHRIVRGGTDKSYGPHVAQLAGVPVEVINRSRELLVELESNFSAQRRAPVRSAKRTKKDDQLLLFTDPADDILEEMRKLDPNNMTPIQALEAITSWRKRLGR